MLVVMVRIPVGSPQDAARLEERFRNRAHLVDDQPGFVSFELLKGNSEFISVTRWRDRASLDAWMGSQSHSEAHGRSPDPTGGGHPQSGPLPQREEGGAGSAMSASTQIYEVVIPGESES